MGRQQSLNAPTPLSDQHQLGAFNSGVPALDEWLRRRARANQISGASRSFVICADDIVVGYYALASGAVNAAVAPGRFRRNMPEPIPWPCWDALQWIKPTTDKASDARCSAIARCA